MQCPVCSYVTDREGALFCDNCGQELLLQLNSSKNYGIEQVTSADTFYLSKHSSNYKDEYFWSLMPDNMYIFTTFAEACRIAESLNEPVIIRTINKE